MHAVTGDASLHAQAVQEALDRQIPTRDDDVHRDNLVALQRGRRLRRDLVEANAGALGDAEKLPEHGRHGDSLRHRAPQRPLSGTHLRPSSRTCTGLGDDELGLGLLDRLIEARRLRALRRNEAEPTDQRGGDDCNGRQRRDDFGDNLSFIRGPPAERTLAPIVNMNAFFVPTSARALDWSETSESAGISTSRSRARATVDCERDNP